MSQKKLYMLPNLITPNKPVVFDEAACDGCNRCVRMCPMDILMPNPEKGKPPLILYPDECWYGACCVAECPNRFKGAIKMVHPIMQKVRWKRKDTGVHFRMGMKNPPPANTKLPVGGWAPRSEISEE